MEILCCRICGQEFDLYYSFRDDTEVVCQTPCRCVTQSKTINGKKLFDAALEVLNEKLVSKNQRHSESSKIRS